MKSRIDDLTAEYKANLQKGDLENAMSKLYAVISLSPEINFPVNESQVEELKNIQKVFEAKEAAKVAKARDKNKKDLQKLEAQYHEAKNQNNFMKAQQLNSKWTDVLCKMFQYDIAVKERLEFYAWKKSR